MRYGSMDTGHWESQCSIQRSEPKISIIYLSAVRVFGNIHKYKICVFIRVQDAKFRCLFERERYYSQIRLRVRVNDVRVLVKDKQQASNKRDPAMFTDTISRGIGKRLIRP